MLLAQGLASFVLWLAWGAFATRNASAFRVSHSGSSRVSKAIWAAGLLIAGGLVLLAAFAYVGDRALQNGRLTGAVWAIISAAGLAFVHLQTRAFATVLSLVQQDVTEAKDATSAHTSYGGTHQP